MALPVAATSNFIIYILCQFHRKRPFSSLGHMRWKMCFIRDCLLNIPMRKIHNFWRETDATYGILRYVIVGADK